MQNDPLYIIFNVVVNFAMLLIFIRFMFDFAGIEQKHPYGRVARRLSAVVDIYSRIFPSKNQLNTAAIVLLLLLSLIKMSGNAMMLGKDLTAIQLFFAATYGAILKFLTALRWTILASVIASWVVFFSNKVPPVVDIIMSLAEPIIAPFRKITPELGMIDLSALVALLSLALMTTVLDVLGQNIWLSMS